MERAPTPRTKPGQGSAAPRRALRVHVVERDRASGLELARTLTARGLTARLICTGEAALAEAAVDRPDLIVLSADLPDMSGYAVCSRLRREPDTEATPIIMTGARADPGTFEAHQRLWVRADAYLPKPFDASAVIQVAAMLVEVPAGASAPTPAPTPTPPPLAAAAPEVRPAARAEPEVLEDGFEYLGGTEAEALDEDLVRVVAVQPVAPSPAEERSQGGEGVLEEGFEYLGGAVEAEPLDEAQVCVAGCEPSIDSASRLAPGRWRLPETLGVAAS